MSEKEYRHDANYPYLQNVLKTRGQISHDVRAALRDYVRVFARLKLKPGDKLLDVGCNIGRLGHNLSYAGVHTYGVDINHDALIEGTKIYGSEARNTLALADGRHLPFSDGSFDAVTSQDVFEHMPDIESARQLLNEMGRVLKKGNRNMFHKITVLEDSENIDTDPSHCIKWSTKEWTSFFAGNGWNVIGNSTRRFPVKSKTSYGNFLLQRAY